MKRYEVNTTIKFKRSNSETTYHETYLIRSSQDINEVVKQWNLENGNHEVSKVEVLSVKNTNYRTKLCNVLGD